MMKRHWEIFGTRIEAVSFLTLFALLLISCAPAISTIMPTNTVISPPRATLTETVMPTDTAEILQVSCPEIKNEIPTNEISGKIVLNGAYQIFDKSTNSYVLNPGSAYLWDIKDNKKIDLLHEEGEELLAFSVSPDHQFLVYDGRKDNRPDRVIVTASEGQVIQNIDEDNWFLPLGWLDNQNLAIWMLGDTPRNGGPFPTLVYDPFTKASKLIMPDYPNIYRGQMLSWPGTLTVYDPTAQYVVYMTQAGEGNGNGSVILWDINQKHEIVKLKNLVAINNHNGPIWSPNGQEFLIDAKLENHSAFELYAVNLNGDIRQLTHFEAGVVQQSATNLKIWNYSWSGDGQYIAFWYNIDDKKVPQLALLDISNGQMKDLCITSYWHNTPVWSPDNQQLLINGFINDQEPNTDYQVVLLDIQDNYAVEIAKDVLPEGWLLDKP